MTQAAIKDMPASPEAKPSAPKAPKKETAKSGSPLILLLFLLIVAGISGSGWLAYQQYLLNAQIEQQVIQLQKSLRALDEHPSLIELKQRMTEHAEQIDARVAEQMQQIEAVREAFAATQSIVNRDQRGWILAEVEYLLRLGIVRLRLTVDVRGATEAFIIADQRLADLADPALLEIRSVLAEEITALKMAAVPDVEGASLQLISLSNQLHLLPRAKRPAVENLDDGAVAQSATTEFFTQALRQIGIRRSDAPVATAAVQARLYYAEQLLRLELDAASRAVLELNKEKLDRHLIKARSLLEEYYDREHEQVIRIRAELAALQEAKLIPELPDITGSLQKLRALQLKYQPAQKTEAEEITE